MPDVPFLSDSRAPSRSSTRPYNEIVRYCAPIATTSTEPHDALLLRCGQPGASIQRAGLFSVGMMDEVTPPSTVTRLQPLRRAKEIREYPFNTHEGGQGFHDQLKMRWLRERLRG